MTIDPFGSRPVGRRAARRAEQLRKRKRNVRIAAVVAGVAVLAAVVGLVSSGGGGKRSHAHKRTQQTVLLQVTGADGTAEASALLAHDPASTQGAVVLVPPQVIVAVPGQGSQQFGQAVTVSQRGSVEALSDLMGVLVDGSWVMDGPTFGRLLDQVGGVRAKVDTTVLSGQTVLLQPGEQHLDGAHALAFATYLAPGELEQTRLARLQAVLDGFVTALPKDVASLVSSLGASSRSSLPVPVLAGLLSGLRKDDAASQLQYQSLPVIKVDTGSDETRFRVDAAATRSMVDQLLADSVPPGVRASGNRVLVLNGVGTPGLGEQVRAKLVPAGFVFVGSRNAPSFGYDTTQVLVKDATTAGQDLGARVARALGVPVSSVQASTQIGTIADVVVIVGRDFHG